MLPDQPSPLTRTDLVRLDHFLHTTACGQEAMGLSYAHGFLTAVTSGPEQLQPAEWLRLIFDEPVFHSGTEAREMLGLALRLQQEIERDLQSDGGMRPVFDYVRTVSGETCADAQPWCRGFLSGFGLFNEYWTADARTSLHTPLNLILRLAGMRSQPDPAYTRLCDAIPDAAGAVYRFWQNASRL